MLNMLVEILAVKVHQELSNLCNVINLMSCDLT